MTTDINGVNGRRALTTSSGDLFNGFFTHPRTYNAANLIDARARRVFEMTARACEADAYPYQLPLQGRSGPMVQAEGRELMMLSSYDYLGLIGDARVDEAAIAAIRKYGTGTGGVRMLTGTIDLHREMEKDLADFKDKGSQRPCGDGIIPFPALFTQLKKMNYQGYINLEYEIDDTDPLPNMIKSFAYMRGVIAGLKG